VYVLVPRQEAFASLLVARFWCETRGMVAEDGSVSGTRTAGFAPCFPVRDVQAALAHYERLGFDVMPHAAGMGWAWVRLGAAELHLFEKGDHDPATTAAAADLEVDDADGLGRMLSVTGVEGTSDPYDTSYGREVVHVGLDSNLLRFIAPRRDHAERP
jgi:hypothetical protein